MKSIIVINDISEAGLFGAADAPEGYDAQQLQHQLKVNLDAIFPGVDIQVWDGDSKTEVQVDGDDREVEGLVMEVINRTWQAWLEQFDNE